MDMTERHQIKAPRQVVWAALNDPEVLKQSIAGCEELVKTSDTELKPRSPPRSAGQGEVQRKVTLSDLNPPNGYTISGEGSGGAAGLRQGRRQGWISRIPPAAPS